VALLARTNKVIVRAIEHANHLLEFRRVAIGKFGRCDALRLGRLEHLDPVLVGPSEKEHVAALQPPKARKRVGCDRLIGMADMGRVVRIRDGSSDVIGPLLCHGDRNSLGGAQGQARSMIALNGMFARELLKPEPSFQQKQTRVEVVFQRLGVCFRYCLPRLSPLSKIAP